MKELLDDEQNDYSKKDNETFFDYLDEDDEIVEKERKEKRKKELEDLEKEKNVLVLYKPNGKKVYYRLTEDIFFNSSTSEKLVSNQQIKEWSIYQMDEFLKHIARKSTKIKFNFS